MNTKKAEISKKGRKELKSIIVDDKKFRYKKDKPIFNVLAKKLLSVKKTNEYRSYTMKKATDVVNRERVRQLITKYAIRNRFRVRDIQPAFRRYANSIVLENKHVQGERGLEMIARQKQRLPERSDFLKNLNMMMEEMNEGELTQALEDSVIQVRLQIQNLEGSTSNLRFERPAK